MLTDRRRAANSRLRRRAQACVLALALCGCSVQRSGYDVPEVQLPREYRNAPGPAVATAAAPAAGIDTREWWRSFGDESLAGLIDRGLANNPDIRIATIRLAQAKAHVDQARAGLFPTLTAPFGASAQAPGGTIGAIPVETGNRNLQTNYAAGLRGTWRVDIWGEARSATEAARFGLWQAGFDRDNVQRNVVAAVASSYIELLTLNDRIRVAREAEAVQAGMLAAVEARMAIGAATRVDLEQQKSLLGSVRAIAPGLEQQREDAHASIAFLVGTVPGAIPVTGHGLEALRTPADPVALPSSLLLQRPDIRMAEARLLSADANVDVARARLLPPLDLSGQAGVTGLSIAKMLSPGALFWNAISSVTATIFDAGKLQSEKANATAVHEEMVEGYARTIYQAVREVETALVAVRTTRQRMHEQREVLQSALRSLEGHAEMYAVGGVDHFGLLESQRSYQRYVEEYLRVRLEHFRGHVSLFQALDGGAGSGAQLPGGGARPRVPDGASKVPAGAPNPATGGLDWSLPDADKDLPAGDPYWHVELPGLYHRATIEATVRDLRRRFPAMEASMVRPRLHGRIADGADPKLAWYRLYVGRFASPGAAQELCAALKADYQRCLVVSSATGRPAHGQ